MSDELVNKLWSWSVHTGDPLFAQAAEEIDRLNKKLLALKPKVFNNVDKLLEDLDEKELDIVEELDFFAEASDSEALVVTMLSGRLFEDAAREIRYLRKITEIPYMAREELVLAQKACQVLYWYAREDFLNNYPNRQYDEEIVEEQKIAALMSKHVRNIINAYIITLTRLEFSEN